MKLIGITGGVGAGKSEILRYIGEHYPCEIYLADQVAHEVQRPGQPCYQRLMELLGEGVLGPDGAIDRKAMASRIFADSGLLERVNQIVHPAVRDYLLERVERARRNGGTAYFFIEAALLIEAGYKDVVDELWYIHADEEVRRKRLEQTRGYTPEKIAQIMGSQLTDAMFRAQCDFVLENNGSLEECYRQIRERLGEGNVK